jgi:hypothetical protein
MVRRELEALGVTEPLRIVDVLAPRFIERRDWERAKAQAAVHPVDPALVYDPAPATWRAWEEAEARVRRELGTDAVPRVRLSRVLELHAVSTAYQGAPTGLRTTSDEIGRSFEEYYSVDDRQVARFGQLEYGDLLTWHNTQCLEERPQEFQRKFRSDLNTYTDVKFWPLTKDPNHAYRNGRGERRRCGFLRYLDHRRLPQELARWERELNRDLEALPNGGDPILLAARAQRWLVAIHPFLSGNGRVSRLVMDELLQRVDLPPPLLAKMNDDLGHSEAEWAREVGAGIVRTLEVLERCAKTKLTDSYCRVLRGLGP